MINSTAVFKEKFIGFVEICPVGDDTSIDQTLGDPSEVKNNLIDQHLKAALITPGQPICPDSKRIQQDLDIEVACESDCVVMSAEISPAGIITLISNCHSFFHEHSGPACTATHGIVFDLFHLNRWPALV